ncbi:transcription-repair coupling factor [Bacteroidota bacterium]
MSIRTIYSGVTGLPQIEDLVARASSRLPAAVRLQAVSGSLASFIVAAVSAESTNGGPVICLLPDNDTAAYLRADLTVILDSLSTGTEHPGAILLPPSGLRPYDAQQSAALATVQQRMDAILAIEDGYQGIIVASAESLVERIPPPSTLELAAPVVRVGQEIRPEALVERLVSFGFSIQEYVEDPGDLAVRGGIIDLFPFAGTYPVRLEFFGDIIESMREFDPVSQRSVSRIPSARLVPDLGELPEGTEFGTLFDFLPANCPVVVFEPDRFVAELDRLFETATAAFSTLDSRSTDDPLPQTPALRYVPGHLIVPEFNHRFVAYLSGGEGDLVNFHSKPPPVFNKAVSLLRTRIIENTSAGITTIILCDGRGQLGRIEELLGATADTFHYQLVLSTLHAGFELPDVKLAVYTDHEIFNRYHRPTAGKRHKGTQRLSIAQLSSLSPGDFVVHVDHGIGRFAGLHKKVVRGREQEVVRLLYEADDSLFVGVNSLHKLHKFSGREGHVPRLTRLGSGQWERIKTRAKKRVKDIARGLIKLYAQRKEAVGFAFSEDTIWQRELEASFQYEDTPDQFQASEDVKNDMQQPVPMDRLVCGDVGFGKTEVAVRAVFKAVQDGKQVAVLVPTTILATQHYKTFTERLAPFAVKVEMLSRFRSAKEQKEVVSRMAEGKIDVVVGTQRLVSKDVSFQNLGLLIIDEEQRFGVAVKEKIRALRTEIDTLTLTATPIPRTLQFSLMGARDLSLINTPPPNRRPIVTEIHSWDTRLVRDAILYEVNRGGQVFFIHNRVRTIEQMVTTLESLVEGVRFRFAHGQMRPHDLEDVMLGFMEKKFDVLVCTNIVESGLDVTNANTMIIDRADRFGLADLHQLRGRVGRSDQRAFCYLFVPSVHTMSREARHRLRAIEEFSDLGSGLNIAMRDLDIRGAGNLLGSEQSGFIDDIGFETYHRILDEAVNELRNEEFNDLFDQPRSDIPRSESTVDLPMDALIPASYVGQANHRLDLYRRMAGADTSPDIDDIVEEMKDRFGASPEEVTNLAITAKLRINAERLRLPRIEFKNSRLFITLPANADTLFYDHIFQPLLTALSALDNRFVVKETGTKTKLIVQDVANLESAIEIMQSLAAE